MKSKKLDGKTVNVENVLSDYLQVQVFSLMVTDNNSQWRSLGSYLSRAGAEGIQKAIELAGTSSSHNPQFAIEVTKDILRKARVQELRNLGFKVKVLGEV